MSAVRALVSVTSIATAIAATFSAIPVSASENPVPEKFEVQTKTVKLADVTSGNQYLAFTVPQCVSEIAYVLSGAEGGASRKTGTNQRAEGGGGAVLVGTLKVVPGEQLRLYPSERGVSAQASSDIGDAGGGGTIGYTHGGGGSGKDQGSWVIGGVRQNAGGGGGASSAITTATEPVVVASGGGGAGGSAWNDAKNTATGGAGDKVGNSGVGYANSGGALGVVANGSGAFANQPLGNGGGGGGGGAGYTGGGGGKSSQTGSQGGGGGAGGTSYAAESRIGTGAVSDYGMSVSEATPAGDGTVKIAWFGCASVLTIHGTTTDQSGTESAAAGWRHDVSVAEGSLSATHGTLDSSGRWDTTLRGYATASQRHAVTVTQEARQDWIVRDWNETTLNSPMATCTIDGDESTLASVTNIDARSFRVEVPADTWVNCTLNTVQAAPDLDVESQATVVSSGEVDPSSVVSGEEVEFSYDIRNTGNIPLKNLTARDPKISKITCQQEALLPGDQTRCVGNLSITSD